MPDASVDVQGLLQIARRTLSRDEHDPHVIPHGYLDALFCHLNMYPQEDHFLMDLEDGGGTLTCLHCWCEVLVANKGKLEDFTAFWDHIATEEHQAVSQKIGNDDQMDMDLDMERPSSNSPYNPPAPLPQHITHRKRIKKTIHYPDGDVLEYSTDEEDVPQPLSQPALGHTSDAMDGPSSLLIASNSQVYPHSTPQNHLSPFHTSGHHGPSLNFTDGPQAPQHNAESSSYRSPFGSSNSSMSLFGDSRPPSSSASSAAFSSPLPVKRPHRGIRRHDFGDGDIVYLSTDDENVDDRPEASTKRPKLGGALIKTKDGIKTENTASGSSINTAYGTYHAMPAMSHSHPDPLPAPVPQPPFQYPSHMSNNNPFVNLDPPATPQADVDYGWGDDFDFGYGMPGGLGGGPAMPGGIGMPEGIGMGYHAPPPAPENPVLIGYVQRPGAGSFNLNFDENGPMERLDIGGPDQAEKLKDFFVSAMEDFHEMPKVVDAAKDLGLNNTSSFLPGLEVQLMPHQLIGVSWMLKQEEKDIKGGILADDMGLGKTVQCIATCTKNRPEKGALRKSTLIVAPAALLEQWAAEFRQRTSSGLFRVYIHHGKDKLHSTKEVRHYHVVITTYQTLCADFPKDKKEKGKGKAAEPEGYDSEDDDSNAWGPLAQTAWLRVVLDEAQCIRNRSTRSSRCVARLDSTYRWALTGTPVINTLTDIYGLVRFLKFRPFDDWKEFNVRIARIQKKRPDIAGQRAQALLKKCLIRRTKDTKLEGKLILQLPPKHIEVVDIEFSPEEREIYAKIEERQRQKMSKFLKAGTVMKNYAAVLVMLLRLRQVCNHPQLIAGDEWDEHGERVVEDVDEDGAQLRVAMSPAEELQRAERLIGVAFVEQVKAKLRTQAQTRIRAEAQGTGVEEEDTDCPICFDTFVNNCRITSCKHLFCGDCLNDLFKNPPNGLDAQDAAYANAMQTGTRSCPVCRGDIHPDLVFKTTPFEPSAAELDAIRRSTKGPEIIDLTADEDTSVPVDIKGKGKVAVKEEAELDDIDLKSLDRGNDFEPSAKMLKMVALIKGWHETAPQDKIICYSQWTTMLTLVETLLHRDNIETVRFDGKMSRVARDEAVTTFKKRNGPSIMLISLKCGGVGLNLVEANRVLCLDLSWNAATENQAFDRVHRMGQQKDVHVKRLIVRNTIEERILNLQATKQSLADAALGEGKAKKIKKMSVGELKALFGM